MKTDRDETCASSRHNFKEVLHLTDDKAAWLQCGVAGSEMSSKRIVEMKDKLHAPIGQDSFPWRIVNRQIAFQRPDRCYVRAEEGMNWVFTIARLVHRLSILALLRLS